MLVLANYSSLSFLDPQFGFNPTTYFCLDDNISKQTTIIITNGVAFQAGVTRTVRVNSVDAQVPVNMQATGDFCLVATNFFWLLTLNIASYNYNSLQ